VGASSLPFPWLEACLAGRFCANVGFQPAVYSNLEEISRNGVHTHDVTQRFQYIFEIQHSTDRIGRIGGIFVPLRPWPLLLGVVSDCGYFGPRDSALSGPSATRCHHLLGSYSHSVYGLWRSAVPLRYTYSVCSDAYNYSTLG